NSTQTSRTVSDACAASCRAWRREFFAASNRAWTSEIFDLAALFSRTATMTKWMKKTTMAARAIPNTVHVRTDQILTEFKPFKVKRWAPHMVLGRLGFLTSAGVITV